MPRFPVSYTSCKPLSDEEFLEGIQPIFKMARSNLESRFEAAKMLFDVAQKDTRYLELPAFRKECVQILEELLNDENDTVCQHTVMAIASFVEVPSYKVSSGSFN